MFADSCVLPRSVVATICVLLGMAIGLFVLFRPAGVLGVDFSAFWCGARALAQHADPYLNQPLHDCEAAAVPAFFSKYPNLTVPAPLPPYALALFGPLAWLPFPAARALWWVLLAGCALLAGTGIARFSDMPAYPAIAAAGFALLAPAFVHGELAPLPIALLIWGALAMRRARWNAAAVLLCAAAIEPHVALPACVAAFLLVPAMRMRLAIGAAAAFGITLLAAGPGTAFAYLAHVLPAHAAGELNNPAQSSLSAILYRRHVAPGAALRAGALQYAAFCVLGIVAARSALRRYRDAAWVALTPPVFAVIGGSFIHLSQIAVALPLACALAVRRPGWVSFSVLCALAIPVEAIVDWPLLAAPAAALLAYLLAVRRAPPPLAMLASAALVAGALWAHGYAGSGMLPSVHAIADPGPRALASVTWSAFNGAYLPSPAWWPLKLCTLLPLAALAYRLGVPMQPARGKLLHYEAAGGAT